MTGTTVVIEWWMGGVATVVGGVVMSVVAWLANRVVNRLEADHKIRAEATLKKLTEIDDRQTAMAASQHRFELALTEMRGAITAIAARQDIHEANAQKNEASHGTLHGRIDKQAERLTRVETRVEMAGAA